MSAYDSLLIVSFGGPESPDEVMDFLHRITAGRNISEARIQKAAERYYSMGGISPANRLNKEFKARLEAELKRSSLNLSVYMGNRNSPPFILDALQEMHQAGKTRALAFITSPFGSYSSCRQYLENIQDAQNSFSQTHQIPAPQVERLRLFYDHPAFIQIHAQALAEELKNTGTDNTQILFTAHSLPLSMAQNCDYEKQLSQAGQLIIDQLQIQELKHQIVYQSISGPPHNWLGPDILSSLEKLAEEGVETVVVVPLGFLSDHMEVVFDLDTDAKSKAESLELKWVRTKTPQSHPDFAEMVAGLIKERTDGRDGQTPIGSCTQECCIIPTPS